MTRQLSIEDMDEAAVVLRRSFDERMPALSGLHTAEEDRLYFREHLFTQCEMWGAFDQVMLGFIAFTDEWIEQLYVLPNFQRIGVGRALLDIAKGRSPSLKLWTFQQNERARTFYERNGFAIIDETDGATNEEKAPDVLFEWKQSS
ncbi:MULTISPECIES: GNAT family N-acetyltransferase [unclassified Rhizobium]|uniref:GNAT family N-acetyltransferase n=2 Tax=Rhizobium TaxID=379 RepID=UPI001ADACFB9|nr:MULTISPECIES: GNAT family N-acetyltransferase [unclassified Rhizobium]MBO9097113.1 GNAT family N-acetyltransferase [Rhizobium sp. L58/93]MBO9134035.1 GNAT family N-acetyltransferase [Rhizobium sp. B209b/85]MBO9183310.1 GNAT family N-acetyltransferase [Rhizobium sp. E27B/91]QXZ83651.1 GNAT family N-acetyltransferase [Rhizobium sp. K1/93]QXZ88837.1 GNAT family N-acetyltransferase [Rhizobium sp. K15/93]